MTRKANKYLSSGLRGIPGKGKTGAQSARLPSASSGKKDHLMQTITYTDEPMRAGKILKDVLPKPGNLKFKKEQVVTLRLDETTVHELKEVAHKKGLGVSTLVRMWVRERLAENAAL